MVQATEAVEPEGTELDWRRPHPITIVVEIGRAIRSVVIALAVVSGGLFDRSSLLELVLIAAPLVGALARWYTTRYALGPESVHHHHGLIWRSKQVLPRSNVQNVSTKAGLLARTASVVELQISDASATGDISLRYLTQTEADRLSTLLRSSFASQEPRAANDDATLGNPEFGNPTLGDPALGNTESGGTESEDTALGDPGPGNTELGNTELGGSEFADTRADAPAPSGAAVPIDNAIVKPTVRQLVRAELSTLGVVSLLALSATAAVVGPVLLLADVLPLPDNAGRVPWFVTLAVVLLPLAISALAVVSQALVLGGYRLFAEPDRLRIQVGLVTEARITARRERIQQVRVERELLHRRLGIERVSFETADLEAEGTAGTRFLSPVGPTDGWRELAMEVFGDVQLGESDLGPVSRLTARRMMVRFVVASIPLLALALLHPLVPIPVIAGLIGFGWWFSNQRFRQLGYAVSQDQYLVRTGVLNGRLTLVRLDKVQSLRLSSTFFQRRLELATVKVSTAGRGFGGLVTLPDVPKDEAEALLAHLSRRVAATPIADTL